MASTVLGGLREYRKKLFEETNGEFPKAPEGYYFNSEFRLCKIKHKKGGNIKDGLSDWQKKDLEEFLKVRPGETSAQWRRRTMKRRVLSDEELAQTTAGKKKILLVKRKKAKRKKRNDKYLDKTQVINVQDSKHDFLKHYLPIISFISVKHGISIDDLHLAYYFHNHPPFTRDQFNNKCRLFVKGEKGVIKRFYENGYIVRHNKDRVVRNIYQLKDDSLFRLSREMRSIINEVYALLSKEREIKIKEGDFKPTMKKPEQQGITDWLFEMNKHISDYLRGEKETEKILYKESEQSAN
jgi:hypothetical protein